MPRKKLTDATIKSLPLPERGQTDYFDTLLAGFGVRVSCHGTRSFFVMTRPGGKLVRFTIGRYPAYGLAEARELAGCAIVQAQRGVNPKDARDLERLAEKQQVKTFGAVGDEFLERYCERHLRASTIRDYRRTLKVVVADWQDRPLSSIERRDIRNLIEDIEAEGKFFLADHTFQYLRKFFNWAAEQEYIEIPPTDRIRRQHKGAARERVLSRQELQDIWAALQRLPYPFGPLLQILMLTGQRKGEVTGLRWDELKNWKRSPVWEMAGARTKNKKPHVVPVVPAVKSIIDECPRLGPLVFTTTGDKPVSGFSKVKLRLDAIVAGVRAERGANENIAPWVYHDFRRSFATHANETLGIEPHVVEAVLNHISGTRAGVAGIYNRAAYLDQRRETLQRWADWVLIQGTYPEQKS